MSRLTACSSVFNELPSNEHCHSQRLTQRVFAQFVNNFEQLFFVKLRSHDKRRENVKSFFSSRFSVHKLIKAKLVDPDSFTTFRDVQ